METNGSVVIIITKRWAEFLGSVSMKKVRKFDTGIEARYADENRIIYFTIVYNWMTEQEDLENVKKNVKRYNR